MSDSADPRSAISSVSQATCSDVWSLASTRSRTIRSAHTRSGSRALAIGARRASVLYASSSPSIGIGASSTLATSVHADRSIAAYMSEPVRLLINTQDGHGEGRLYVTGLCQSTTGNVQELHFQSPVAVEARAFEAKGGVEQRSYLELAG